MLNGETLIYAALRTKKRMPIITAVNMVLEVPANAIRHNKEMRGGSDRGSKAQDKAGAVQESA